MNQLTDLSASQLRRAADLKERIDGLHKELEQFLGASAPHNHERMPQKQRKMSAAARARIAAGAKARWARIKGKAPSKPAQPGRKMSAEARARLAAIARARWKKARAAGRTAL
jgi:hypothetical protein